MLSTPYLTNEPSPGEPQPREPGPEVQQPGEGCHDAEGGLDGLDEAGAGRDRHEHDAAAANGPASAAPGVRHAEGADGAAEGQGQGEYIESLSCMKIFLFAGNLNHVEV